MNDFVLSLPIVTSSLSYSRAAIKDVFLLEFHPSLAIASQIPAALSHAYWVGFANCHYS